MINDLKKDCEVRMQKTLDALEQAFSRVRTGRAHPSMLKDVMVPYYGTDTPLMQVANVNVDDSRTLIVQPYERNMVGAIDKAIRNSNLGLNPVTTDVIRVPLPALTEQTRQLIGARELALLKPDALLINTARGGLVDEQALADSLRAGHLGGAAFDVLSEEPPRQGNPLLAGDIPRLIITPHNAWGSREARQRIVGQMAENASAFFAGAPVRVVG